MAQRAPTAAYVLHRYDWSETSLILDLFTRDQGRVAVVAKGAKRPYSQLRGVLLPFQRLLAHYGRRAADGDSQAEVHTLKSAEWAGGGPMLTGAALLSGFYLNELLMKLLARSDAHPVLFDAYAQTLPLLAAGQDDVAEAGLRAFELVLLREIGLLPELALITLTQQPLREGAAHVLRPESGVGTAAAGEAGIAAETLQALQAALDARSQPALQRAAALALPELKLQLRALLHYHLGSSPLHTRKVALDVQKLLE
jgi:DNA repair protein RecO (recombination protein O)